MDIFMLFTLAGGLAFFLYGMHILSTGLEKMAGGNLEITLKKMTSNKFKSLLLGMGITTAIQSSSAMTVMLVGLVNSGIMQLDQTIGVIMGSNIGTTFTAWILSLSGLESSNFFIQMLKPMSFSPILALIGIILVMTSKNSRRKDIGNIMLGFAILMFGMELMSSSVSPLANSPEFSKILTMFKNPLIGVLIGTLFTGVIQSSAASIGVLQALALTGQINFGMAIPIIMGQNIGTCVTALISSIGTNKNARRVTAVHVYFNLIGTVICLGVFYSANYFLRFSFIDQGISPVQIAMVHTIFNVATTALLLPFSKLLEKLARLTIRDKNEQKYEFLDERLLLSPSFAIEECKNLTIKMAEMARDTLYKAIDLVDNYNEASASEISKSESEIDMYEDKLGTYLVKLSSKELSDSHSLEISKLLHTIGDFERIGDHALNIKKLAKEINDKKIKFSNDAIAELRTLTAAITEILAITIESFKNSDADLASRVEPLEQVVDELKAEIKHRHITRLQNGICTIELGFILADLLTNYERVSDHCSNVAVCVIQIKDAAFDTHIYLNDIKTSGTTRYLRDFNNYREKYLLPK